MIGKTFVVEVEVDVSFVLSNLAVANWLDLDLVSDHGVCVFKPIDVFVQDVGHDLSVWDDPLEGEVVRRTNFRADGRDSEFAEDPV